MTRRQAAAAVWAPLLCAVALAVATAAAQDSPTDPAAGDEEAAAEEAAAAWQYDPYRVLVWIAVDYDGSLTPLLPAIQARLSAGAEAVAFSTWSLQSEPVPDSLLRADMVGRLEDLTSNQFFALAGMSTVRVPEPGAPPPRNDEEQEQKFAVASQADRLRDAINGNDKIMLAAVRSSPLGFEVVCREVDTATRNIGLPHRRTTRQRSMIPHQVFGVVSQAFRPLVRIQDVSANGKDAQGLTRAGGLVEGVDSPSYVGVDDALLPVVRTNDRLGQPKEFNGIRATEWSYLHVTGQDEENVQLRLHSALRGPLGGRGGSRVKRYGLKVRPRDKTTKVRLISKQRQRPLSGYEIYSRHLVDKEDSVFIGLTNWNGEIDVEQQGAVPLRLLYIKNGGSLLAGIPLLAGHHEFLQAEMRDDEIRLQAEAFVRSIQNTILDTVAQRQMIGTRIRKAMESNEREQAEEELRKFRKLSTLTEVLDLLNQRKKDMATADRRMQMQIDLMFSETQELAIEYLDDEQEAQLNRLVNPIAGGGAAPPSKAPAKKAPKKSAPKQAAPKKSGSAKQPTAEAP